MKLYESGKFVVVKLIHRDEIDEEGDDPNPRVVVEVEVKT